MYLVNFICPRFGVQSRSRAPAHAHSDERRGRALCSRVIHAVCHVAGRNETCPSGLIKDSSDSLEASAFNSPPDGGGSKAAVAAASGREHRRNGVCLYNGVREGARSTVLQRERRYLLRGRTTKRPLINSAVSLASPFRDFASFAAIGPEKLFIIARFRGLSIPLTATVTTVCISRLS